MYFFKLMTFIIYYLVHILYFLLQSNLEMLCQLTLKEPTRYQINKFLVSTSGNNDTQYNILLMYRYNFLNIFLKYLITVCHLFSSFFSGIIFKFYKTKTF
jgi:hypothetical protein